MGQADDRTLSFPETSTTTLSSHGTMERDMCRVEIVMQSLWGGLFLIVVCPVLGGIPLSGWIVRAIAGQNLANLGTRNVGVSAAFYHGGFWPGCFAIALEAGKSLLAVYGVRALLPSDPTWELAALVALVAGRYLFGKGAGTTNAFWGVLFYQWKVALVLFVLSGGWFSIQRDRQTGRIGVLILLPLVIALMRGDPSEVLMATALAGLLGWIYTQLPDDLDLSTTQANAESQKMFRFFRGDRALLSLERPLLAHKVGNKAATLSLLKRWGYAVPDGWVLPPGDDPDLLVEYLQPSPEQPMVVRSSAIGEDGAFASSAGQYESILKVTSRGGLRRAIERCQDSYEDVDASQYRRDQEVAEGGMAVIVQQQISGEFSGVAFSRDPLGGEGVAIEALPGAATQVVSGQHTPECYRIHGQESSAPNIERKGDASRVPDALIQEVARVVRELEHRFHGIPQDMEWTHDGEQLWILQTRPITTLSPIWTRRIAAEVIPGIIRPLPWSINNPLTCGVWADLFQLVLGPQSAPIAAQLATLHYGRAYFNATLLSQLFRQMGLPPQSLEFLTYGTSMGKPSLGGMLKTLPGLFRLLGSEWNLPSRFHTLHQKQWAPLLQQLNQLSAAGLSPKAKIERIETILAALKQVTQFSILAPLSFALRQALLKVPDTALNQSLLPETAAMRSLEAIATRHKTTLATTSTWEASPESLRQDLETFLQQYGYLSETATDISVPRWSEHPQTLFTLLQVFTDSKQNPAGNPSKLPKGLKARGLQRRLTLKGAVAQVYCQFLAELRYTFLALAEQGVQVGLLEDINDIFFLAWPEIKGWVNQSVAIAELQATITHRKAEFSAALLLEAPPGVVYGNTAPPLTETPPSPTSGNLYQGIGASPGAVVGTICVLASLKQIPKTLNQQTILVVPYTDAGWAPLLSQVGGIISEVGGRLSHGAIVAREYGIPAVMDIQNATQQFKTGQQVQLNGQTGVVEVLSENPATLSNPAP
jgi:phosphohistidine swiveling domain-containing protein/glycerol-3-phosphate acyltransferase PlsY